MTFFGRDIARNDSIRRWHYINNEMLIDDIATFFVLQELDNARKHTAKSRKRKRYWVHDIFRLRNAHGFYNAIFPTISRHEPEFRNYFRMSLTQFEELLALVGPTIQKRYVVRVPIPAGARLALTLRYLAIGDAICSMSMQYLVGRTTATTIITETCAAIWNCLKEQVLKYPRTKEEWQTVADAFERRWNFPHCIGAIDGRHIRIQCPPNSGSTYFNYKSYHSLVLLAICDANYNLIFVDIGAYGRQSDGGIYRTSAIGRKFYGKRVDLPAPKPLTPEGTPVPYVIVGDGAFELTDFMMRPFPGRAHLSPERQIYNYRLSRARRMIENTFGILASRWRILRRPIESTVESTMKQIQAIVCLHNWLRKNDVNEYLTPELIDYDGPEGFRPGSWRTDNDGLSILEPVTKVGQNNSTISAQNIRQEFCDHFNSEGAIPWQYGKF